jgi:hypothetical protein
VLLYAWAAIHYLVGAMGLSQEMRAAAPSDVDQLV